jgi:hypothetical protein
LIDRRRFLGASCGLLLWPLVKPTPANSKPLLEGATLKALAESPYVYVSPLLSDGEESSCHAEVWFGWIDGSVVVNTSPDRWKSISVKRGLDRARIWVGDYGRWKRSLGKNEGFRSGPVFDARAESIEDVGVLDRLLAIYETKYPTEISKWRGPMREGFHDGSRVLIGYRPV